MDSFDFDGQKWFLHPRAVESVSETALIWNSSINLRCRMDTKKKKREREKDRENFFLEKYVFQRKLHTENQ